MCLLSVVCGVLLGVACCFVVVGCWLLPLLLLCLVCLMCVAFVVVRCCCCLLLIVNGLLFVVVVCEFRLWFVG